MVVGVLVAFQSKINAELAGFVGGGLPAAAISFGTGLILLLVLVAIRPEVRSGVAGLPGHVRAGRLRAWYLLGGLGGAWLVTTQGLVVVPVGVTIFMVSVVAGQVTGSLGVDRIGLSPAGVLPVTRQRGIASALALVAVGFGGWSPNGGSVSWVVLLAVSAGLGISVQQAVNARVSVAAQSPTVAATVNFVVGFTALALVFAVLVLLGAAEFGHWPAQWWLYLGGPAGVAFIALAAWAVRGLGVLAFSLLAIAGQLVGAVVTDLVFPAADSVLGWPQWFGLALIAVAVWLAALRRDPRPDATLDR